MGSGIGILAALGLLTALVAPAVVICRMADQAEREDAQRNLLGLLAEQVSVDEQARVDERAIADNMDI
jgi:hypothetical protein